MKLSSLPLTLNLRSQLARSRIVGLAFLGLFSTLLHAGPSTQPLQVQGVVEEINDVLRTPYSKAYIMQTNLSNARFSIDIPTGKRLVVETVSFRLTVKHNVFAAVSLEPWIGTARAPVYLSTQSSTAVNQSGNTTYGVHTGTHALQLRVDGRTNMSNELEFAIARQVRDTSDIYLHGTVTGYLVDIPTP